MSVYHCKTDAGEYLNITAPNAGEAVGMALKKRKGKRITECWMGDDNARINFDIPTHEPVSKTPKPKVKRPTQTQLFS